MASNDEEYLNDTFIVQGITLKIRKRDLLPELIFEPPLDMQQGLPHIVRLVIRAIEEVTSKAYADWNAKEVPAPWPPITEQEVESVKDLWRGIEEKCRQIEAVSPTLANNWGCRVGQRYTRQEELPVELL